MADTLGRCVLLTPPGTGGGSDPTAELRPLSSLLGTLMVSDGNHLANENPLRTLFSDRGFVGTKSLYAPSVWGNAYVSAPPPEAINWSNPIDATGAYTGVANLRMGSHAIAPWGSTRRLPWVRLRCRVKAPVAFVAGLVFCLARGRNATPTNASGSGSGLGYDSAVVTSTSYVDVTLTLRLRPEDLSHESVNVATGYTASGVPAYAENTQRDMLTLWFGAYCSSTSAAKVASIAGITCYLLEPS